MSAEPSALSSTSSPSDPDDRERQELEPSDEVETVEGEVLYPERRPRQTSRRLEWQESRYISPLPSPEDLERYSELLADAPERLLAAGEREQSHRHEIESRLAALDEVGMPRFYEGQRRGHLISLALGAGYETIMAIAVIKGYALEGVVGAAAGIASMIWALRRSPGSGVPDHEHPESETASGSD